MNSCSVTNASLLIRIRDHEDNSAWAEFVEIYAPLVYSYLRKRGVQDADAADIAQDVLRTVSQKSADFSYDRRRGSFRGWLLTVTLNRLRDFTAAQACKVRASGKTETLRLLETQPIPEATDAWNLQHRMRLFGWAAEKAKSDFREKTWQAFQWNAMEDMPAKDVAEKLSISVGAVHIAKSRVLVRIREIVNEVEGEGTNE